SMGTGPNGGKMLFLRLRLACGRRCDLSVKGVAEVSVAYQRLPGLIQEKQDVVVPFLQQQRRLVLGRIQSVNDRLRIRVGTANDPPVSFACLFGTQTVLHLVGRGGSRVGVLEKGNAPFDPRAALNPRDLQLTSDPCAGASAPEYPEHRGSRRNR